MQYLTEELNFIFVVAGLFCTLTFINILSQYQSRKRAKQVAFKNSFVPKHQAKVIPLPKNGKMTSSGAIVREVELEADMV